MSVLLTAIAAAVVTLAAWLRLSRRHRHVWTVFVAYLSLLPLFAVTYRELYRQDPSNFAFASAVADSRDSEVNAAIQKDIDRVKHTEAQIHHLLATIESAPILPINSKIPLRMNVTDGQAVAVVAHVPPTRPNPAAPQARLIHQLPTTDPPSTGGFVTLVRGYEHSGSPLVDHVVLLSIGSDMEFSNYVASKPHADSMPRLDAELLKAETLSWLSHTAAERESLETKKAIPRNLRIGEWDLLDFLYFSVITQATIGYGDILPNSRSTRMVVMTQVMLSVALLTIVLAYAATFIQRGR